MDTYTPMRAMIVCANGTGDYIKKEDAKQNFRDSLEEVIESADDILSNEDKLKIIISVTNYNFGD